ncbi:MAG: inorganic diphosphatase [Clostridia bacterium]|nr:inorganic diphosphatase [Clostridia bacterium]
MTLEERKKLSHSYLGELVTIQIDRPIGSVHPKYADLIYPINYGYIPDVFGGDGEELDVYLLRVDAPIKAYTARIIGVVHRRDDVEDKLIAAPEGMYYTAIEMKQAVHFQERYFDSEIESIFEK